MIEAAFALCFATIFYPLVMQRAMEAHTVNSRNFAFLRAHNRELAELGVFAEHCAYSDPASALVKLRLCGENLNLMWWPQVCDWTRRSR